MLLMLLMLQCSMFGPPARPCWSRDHRGTFCKWHGSAGTACPRKQRSLKLQGRLAPLGTQ